MLRNRQLFGRALPTALLLGLFLGGFGLDRPDSTSGTLAAPDRPASSTSDSAESVETLGARPRAEAGNHIVPMVPPSELDLAWPALYASSQASGAASDRVSAASDDGGARPEQAPGVEIYSDLVADCARVDDDDAPWLDCTVMELSTLQLRLRANATGASAEAAMVSLSAQGLPAGMRLSMLDDAGAPVPGPVKGSGGVNAALTFQPPAGSATPPDKAIMVGLRAELVSDDGSTQAEAWLRLRIHVLPAGGGHVNGRVYQDLDGDGDRDLGEPAVPGWTVTLSGSSNQVTSTDEQGRFAFLDLLPGDYSVAWQPATGWAATRPAVVDFKVVAGQPDVIEVLFGMRRVEQVDSASARLQTDRGCGQLTGTYLLGETMQVFLEAKGRSEFDLSLDRLLPDGSVESLLDRRRVPGAQAFSFQTEVGAQVGDYDLRLAAYDPKDGAAQPLATANCAYHVGARQSATIGYDPQSLDFGGVEQGASVYRSITVRNDGQSELVINSLAMQGGAGSPFRIMTLGLDGLRLAPGQSQDIDLSYTPSGVGSHQDFLLIRCSALNQPLVTVPLYGQTSTGAPISSGYVRTDRGCIETGESPLYFVGDPIQLGMRVDSSTVSEAIARIEDVSPDGRTRVIFNRSVPVNQDLSLGGARIGPPVGNESLRLTAQVGYEVVRNECSFRVAAGGTRIVGYKYDDKNGNGIWEGCPTTPWIPGGEPPIPAWGITLTGPESYVSQTDANGRYEFVVSTPGVYYVTEEQRSGWQPTRPASVSINLQCFPGEKVPLVLFGNKQVGGCDPAKDPCAPNPTPPFLPTVTPNFPSPTPSTATATVAAPTPTTPGNPPPPPPVCTAQISPRPSLMNVGDLASFWVSVNGGGQVLGYQWAVSGDVIRDYSELTRQSWSVTSMQSADYQNANLSFYWKPEANQRHPQNAGPQARQVSITVTTAEGECSTQHVLNVERNNTSLSRQAEDLYTGNHGTAILTEHTLWHATYPFAGWAYDGTLFFDFHRQFLNRTNSWRAEFGYPPTAIWDSATSLPRGIDIDHAARAPVYVPQPKPSWFTLNGLMARPGNTLPCDSSRGGERNLRDYPSNRRQLGCATTHPWHNAVHTGIGGDMLNPQFSPRDPIFWRWHNFIDVISQERMGVFASLLFDRSDPNDQNLPDLPDDLDAQDNAPRVTYQEPFRLYRFLDGLDDFAVEFDQPVSGVTAELLEVNGSPATVVENIGNQRFVFGGFVEPGLGKVEVVLAEGNVKSIFNVAFEGDRWRYYIVDPDIDEDRDGLLGRDELDVYLTSPIDRDSDDDGLSDGDEVRLYHTRPLMWDSDLDGANDRCELEKGSDPNDPADTAVGCPVSSIFVCWAGNGAPIDN